MYYKCNQQLSKQEIAKLSELLHMITRAVRIPKIDKLAILVLQSEKLVEKISRCISVHLDNYFLRKLHILSIFLKSNKHMDDFENETPFPYRMITMVN